MSTRTCRHTFALAALIAAASTAPTASEAQEVIENSIGMKLVRVPAGEFMMGSDETPEALTMAYPPYPRDRFEKLGDEAPVHRVRITHDFYLGQYEVTVGQFRRFVGQSGYVPESVRDGTGGYGYNADYDPSKTTRGDAFEGRDPKYSWLNPGFRQGDDEPVVNITYGDALALAAWLSKQEGRHYRLPTEAEWEYAARAGTRTRYYNGDNPENLIAIANTFDADTVVNWTHWQPYALAGHDGYAFTAPVGRFAPNAFGLYDMLGNAWEWVADWYGADTYANSPVDDPQGPATGDRRVRRGGSWHTWSFYARAAFRNWNNEPTRYTLLGMRLVLEAPPAR